MIFDKLMGNYFWVQKEKIKYRVRRIKVETEEKKLTSSEIDQMLEEAAVYHVEPKEPSNKDKKNKKKKKKIIKKKIMLSSIRVKM